MVFIDIKKKSLQQDTQGFTLVGLNKTNVPKGYIEIIKGVYEETAMSMRATYDVWRNM